MKHLKMEVSLLGFDRRIYRTFVLDKNISLEEFAVKTLSTFNAYFEHMFFFQLKDKQLVHPLWMDNYFLECDNYKNYSIDDLYKLNIKSFIMCYDSGEDYRFKCSFLEEVEVDHKLEDKIEVLKGRGFGIFENDSYLLYKFIELKSLKDALKFITKDITGEETDFADYMPYNVPYDVDATLDDYFEELDLESLNQMMFVDYQEYLKMNEE